MDEDQKKLLFDKLIALAGKEAGAGEDLVLYINESQFGVQVMSKSKSDDIKSVRLLGDYIWNHDSTCLIRIQYTIGSIGPRGTIDVYYSNKPLYNTPEEAERALAEHVHADLMGSVTYTIIKQYTTSGVPY
jgi:hypothetical protein